METKIFVNSNKTLKKVLVCSPQNFKKTVPINRTEERTFLHNINVNKLIYEFNEFTQVLQDLGVEVVYLPPDENLPQQTFVRDLGFTLDNTFYFGKSNVQIRQKEFKTAKQHLNCSSVYEFENYLEGGDVVIFNDKIFVGISKRTSFNAVIELQTILQNKYEIIPIKLEPEILHLDTVLNVVGNIIVINRHGIETKINPNLYGKVVTSYLSEQYYLPTNFLPINEKTIIANSYCKRTNSALRKLGVNVIEVKLEEMVKLGGSFRCCSMELIKE